MKRKKRILVLHLLLLKTKLFELEKKYEMQVLRHEQLTRDMSLLRQEATNTTMPNASGVHSMLCDRHGRSYLSSPVRISSGKGHPVFHLNAFPLKPEKFSFILVSHCN